MSSGVISAIPRWPGSPAEEADPDLAGRVVRSKRSRLCWPEPTTAGNNEQGGNKKEKSHG